MTIVLPSGLKPMMRRVVDWRTMYEATATAADSGPSDSSDRRSRLAVMWLERPQKELPDEAAADAWFRGCGGASCAHVRTG